MKKKLSALLIALTVALTTTTVFAYTDVYTVKPGDTVYRISKTYDVTVNEITNLNKLDDPAKIYIGEKLYIPVPSKNLTPTGKSPSTANTNYPKNGTGSASTTTPNTSTPPNNGGGSTTTNRPSNGGSTTTNKPSTGGGSTTTNTGSGSNTSTGGDLTAPSGNVNVSMAQEILTLVNKERAKAGVPALTLSTEVSSVAQVKAQDMASNGYFDHNSPTYGSPFAMLTDFGVTYRSAGENIAKGQQSASAVMTAWMNSSGHKANILSTNFTQLGVGYSANNGSPVWVQMFISK